MKLHEDEVFSPEDRDAQVVSSSDVRSFDVVTEQNESDEQIVDVGFVDREEDHGYILLKKNDKRLFKILRNNHKNECNIHEKPNIVRFAAPDLCCCLLDHFQLSFVDLDTPEEAIKQPQ